MQHKKKKILKRLVTPAAPVVGVVNDDIEKLSFTGFLKCYIDRDFSPLIVSGSPAVEDIKKAWVTILSRYYTLIKSTESVKYVRMVCSIEKLHLKIVIVRSLCQALRASYCSSLTQCLKDWGYRRLFTEQSMKADLDRVETELQNENFQLKKLLMIHDKEEVSRNSKNKTNKESYLRILFAIDAHRKMVHHPDEVSLYKFAILYNELAEYNELMRKAHGKL